MSNKVYYDLNYTPFKYAYKDFILYFSSAFHRNKFEREINEYIKNETLKIINRYKVKIDLEIFLIIAFYKKVENRGFKIYQNGLEIEQDDILKSLYII